MKYYLFGLAICAFFTAVGACGGAYKSTSVAASVPTLAGGATGGAAPITTELEEQMIVEGAVHLEITEPQGLIEGLRRFVEGVGGRVVGEDTSGLGQEWRSQLKLRVPPAQLEATVTYLAGRGEILDKSISATDVSKTLFDKELALKNAQLTLDRLEGVLKQGGLQMQEVLAIERELTRLRGEIEQIKGQTQYLKDRVELAVLNVTITRKSGAVHIASAKAYPGARVAALYLLSADGRPQGRLGAGFVLHTFFRSMTFELDLFERSHGPDIDSDESFAVLATYGGAFYSDFLGRGERQFLNPYLGFRVGYGYLDSHRFAMQAEAGLELWKTARFSIDTNVRATGLIGSRSDAAAVVGASAVLAF